MMMALYFMSNSLPFFRDKGKNSNIGFLQLPGSGTQARCGSNRCSL